MDRLSAGGKIPAADGVVIAGILDTDLVREGSGAGGIGADGVALYLYARSTAIDNSNCKGS
jgi:hypothetical protein